MEHKGYDERNLAENCGSQITKGERLTANLRQKRSICPAVGPNGESECPRAEAENLYAAAEEAEEAVRRMIIECEECLHAIDGKLDQLRRNGQLIEGGQSSLHNPEPKTELSHAEQAVRQQYEKVLQQRSQMEQLLSRMSQALQEPSRKWPLGKPQKHPNFGSGTVPGSQPPLIHPPERSGGSPRAASVTSRLPGELESLASLGPVGDRQESSGG